MNKQGISKGSSRNSKAFDHCLSVLFEEIQLATQWNRPSILLAVHPSADGRAKAQRSLQRKLASLSKAVIHIRHNHEHPDLFQTIQKTFATDQVVYFVEHLGRDGDNYRALNLRREELVEKSIIIIFWLSEREASELPRLAPDFWAFRHRVIEFAPSRGSGRKALPSGLLRWQENTPVGIMESIEERIISQEMLLRGLPSTNEAFMLRAEAVYILAGLYYFKGENQKAKELLQDVMENAALANAPDIYATFLNGLAMISYEQMEYNQALDQLLKATGSKPGDRVLWTNMGVTYYALGKSGLAIRTLKKAVRPDTQSSWQWYVLGFVHVSLGDLDMALSSFEESINLNKENTPASYAIAVCHLLMDAGYEPKEHLQHLRSQSMMPDFYREICSDALAGDEKAALHKLRSALENRSISPVFLRRDPILNIIFEDITVQSLLYDMQ